MKTSKNQKENWAKKAVVYHIYPRSFKDSNGDGIGDLNGIIEKLDYLNDNTEKSLGIGAIWLSPVYKSPMVDFGYDISDFYDIDSIFGDLKTFNRLVKEAHKRNIKIIMDFVPKHTSAEHPWFIKSRSSKNNPKRNWYIWRDPKPDGSPPNNWLSVFGGSAWEFDKKTNQYYIHSHLKEQPDLNWQNQEVKNEMIKVLEFWLHKKVDGFRADAVDNLIKDSKFRDDPPNPDYVPGKDDPYNFLLHTYSEGHQEKLKHLNTLCQVLGKHTDKFLVSETYLNIPGLRQLYGACANKLHAPLNLNFIGFPWQAATYKKFIDEFEMSLEPDDIPNYALGNHDRARVASRLGLMRAKAAALLIFTLRGMPFIYYGEETGMLNGTIPPEKILDPWGRLVPGFGLGRDPERTPMQWTPQKYAGFSTKEPWLPVTDGYEILNVESELKDPNSTLNLYRHLIHFRKKSPALLYGSYHSLELQGQGRVFAFGRQHENDSVLVLINFSDEECEVSLDLNNLKDFHLQDKQGQIVCNTHCDKFGQKLNLEKFILRPNEGYVID